MQYFLLLLVLGACVSGPKSKVTDPKAGPAQYWNGENYEAPVVILGVFAVAERKTKPSTIRGQVLSGATRMPFPVNGAQVRIERAGELLASVRTGPDGKFEFVGAFADGEYDLVWTQPPRTLTSKIKLEGYLAEGIELRDLRKE
jgi:hypothetical protein